MAVPIRHRHSKTATFKKTREQELKVASVWLRVSSRP